MLYSTYIVGHNLCWPILVPFKNIVSALASFFHCFHCLFSMTGSRKILQGSWLGHGDFQPWELGDFLCKCMD